MASAVSVSAQPFSRRKAICGLDIAPDAMRTPISLVHIPNVASSRASRANARNNDVL